jgi:ATP/maltotriose-dependent transcriptional regulator MalT
MTCFEESLQVCQATGNRRDEGWALHCLAIAYGELGDHTTARAYGEQALRVHDETGDRLGKIWACLVLYRADVHAGDYAGATDRMGPVRELYERVAVVFLGDLALVQGDYRLARAEYEAGLRLSSPESGMSCAALCGLARIALVEGDVEGAQGYAAEILHGLEAWQVGWTGYFLGLTPYSVCYQVLHASGDPRAREVLKEGYRLLCARADGIDDPALRRSYLENVVVNREIAAAWNERRSASPIVPPHVEE